MGTGVHNVSKSETLADPTRHIIEFIFHRIGILTGGRLAGLAGREPMQRALDGDELLVGALGGFIHLLVSSRTKSCAPMAVIRRSEERRVGEECRSRTWPLHA